MMLALQYAGGLAGDSAVSKKNDIANTVPDCLSSR